MEKEDGTIDYIVNALDIPCWYYLIVGALLFLSRIITKRWTISILVSYMFFVLTLTVFVRKPGLIANYELLPFWSYVEFVRKKNMTLLLQIVANVALFIPIGALLYRLVLFRAILLGLLFSLSIEIAQYITQRGLFEIDDIYHNTLGVIVGVMSCYFITRLRVALNEPKK